MAFSATRFGLALWTAFILAFAPLVSTAHQTTMLGDDPTLAPVRSMASLASIFVSDWIGGPEASATMQSSAAKAGLTTACLPDGQPCRFDMDCCQHVCKNKMVCEAQLFCAAPGAACKTHADCCEQRCDTHALKCK